MLALGTVTAQERRLCSGPASGSPGSPGWDWRWGSFSPLRCIFLSHRPKRVRLWEFAFGQTVRVRGPRRDRGLKKHTGLGFLLREGPGARLAAVDSPPLSCGLRPVLRREGRSSLSCGHSDPPAAPPGKMESHPHRRDGSTEAGAERGRKAPWEARAAAGWPRGVGRPLPGKGVLRMRRGGSGQGRAGGPQGPRGISGGKVPAAGEGGSGRLGAGSRREGQWPSCRRDDPGPRSNSSE